MIKLLRETKQYARTSAEFDDKLTVDWGDLIVKCKADWEMNVNAPSLEAEPLDEQEILEQRMILWGEEEEEFRLPLDEIKVEDEYEYEVEDEVELEYD